MEMKFDVCFKTLIELRRLSTSNAKVKGKVKFYSSDFETEVYHTAESSLTGVYECSGKGSAEELVTCINILHFDH